MIDSGNFKSAAQALKQLFDSAEALIKKAEQYRVGLAIPAISELRYADQLFFKQIRNFQEDYKHEVIGDLVPDCVRLMGKVHTINEQLRYPPDCLRRMLKRPKQKPASAFSKATAKSQGSALDPPGG